MMSKIDLQELKSIELDLLLQFALFCDRHQLRYDLACGTLLGAVKYQGFIPWDDDIDVSMPRPDYERFLQLTAGRLSADIDVLTYKNSPGYIYPYAKAVNNKTVVIEDEVGSAHAIGVFMDIFPIDGLSGTDKTIRRLNRIRDFYVRLLFWSVGSYYRGNSRFKAMLKKCILILCRLIGFRRFAAIIDTLSQKHSFEQSKHVARIIWSKRIFPICKREYVKQTALEFEGFCFLAPSNYDLLLREQFGDYLKMPPLEKQISNHRFQAFRKSDL